jgi:PKD repeat protein
VARRPPRRAASLGVLALLFLAGLAGFLPVSEAADEAVVLDNTPVLVFDGNATDVPDGLPVTISLSLGWRDPQGVARLLRDQQDPASPLYHAWLPTADFQARFGPSPQDVAAARDFLASKGFTTTQPTARHVVGQGTAAMAEEAFRVRIEEGTHHGKRVHRNDRDPVLPASLAARVVHVGGLENITAPAPAYAPRDGEMAPQWASAAVLSRDLQDAYGADGLFADGFRGVPGQEIAIASWGSLYLDDLNDALGAQGSAYAPFNVGGNGASTISATCIPGSGSGLGCAVTEMETALDAAEIAGPANDAHIGLYLARDTTVAAFDVMYQYLADRADTIHTVSHSWGACLAMMPGAAVVDGEAAFAQAAAAGQAWFVASGDDGSAGCARQGSSVTSVDYPSSSPHVTAVGGTWLTPTFDGDGWLDGWAGETGCSNSGGGRANNAPAGTSTLFARPSWQWGPGIANASTPQRLTPDVSLHYGVCGNTPFNSWMPYVIAYEGDTIAVSGTSASAPAWAALWAALGESAGVDLGPAAPLLYRVLRGEGGSGAPSALHDVTTGSNGAYGARTGYDMVTGVGTPSFPFLAPALARLAHGFRAAIASPAAPATAERQEAIAFTDGSVGGADCAPSEWAWDFGDGDTSIAQNPMHAYADSGSFTVALHVRGACGIDDTVTRVVGVANARPIAVLAVSPDPARAGNLTLDGTDSSDADGDVTFYFFTIDGRRQPAQATPTLDLAVPRAGTHLIRLAVTDDDGAASDVTSLTVSVGMGNLTSLTLMPAAPRIVVGGAVTFTARAMDTFRNRGPGAPTWAATCGSVDSAGRFTAPAAPGNCTVSATQDGLTAQAVAKVVAGPLATITVTGPASVAPNATAQFEADGEDAFGNPVAFRAMWRAGCGRTSASGIYTAPRAPATCTVTARGAGVSGSAVVAVA